MQTSVYQAELRLRQRELRGRMNKQEALKCILVCSNCHKEIHSKIGYTNIEEY